MKHILFTTITVALTLVSLIISGNATIAQAQTGFSCTNVTEIPVAECNELVNLYNSTNGANWTNKTGWLSTNMPCSWYGITCSAGHVTEIELDYNNVSGTLPNLNLPNLTRFSLRGNDSYKLSGTIPNFSNLPNFNCT